MRANLHMKQRQNQENVRSKNNNTTLHFENGDVHEDNRFAGV